MFQLLFRIVDKHGHIILVHRMENSLLASIELSQNKAFSAVVLQMPTHEISRQSQPGEELYGIATTNQNRIVTFGGGYPLKANGTVIGAIGVSGGTVKEDMAIAEEIIRTFENTTEVMKK